MVLLENSSKGILVLLVLIGLFVLITSGVVLGNANQNLSDCSNQAKVKQIKEASGVGVGAGAVLLIIAGASLYLQHKAGGGSP